jgi:hypothetical protein
MDIGALVFPEFCATGTDTGPPTLADAVLAEGRSQIEKTRIAKDVMPKKTARRLRSEIGLIPSGMCGLQHRKQC